MAKRIWNYPGLFIAWGFANGQFNASVDIPKWYEMGFRWFCLEAHHFDGKPLKEQVDEIRAELKKHTGTFFGLWQDTGYDPGTVYYSDYKPNFMVLNVETPKAHDEAKILVSYIRHKQPKLPLGVITNFGGIDTKAEASFYVKNNVVCIPEAYMNTNGQATPLAMIFEAVRRGWKEADVFPCYGVWGGYQYKTYTMYNSRISGHSVYLAEGLQ